MCIIHVVMIFTNHNIYIYISETSTTRVNIGNICSPFFSATWYQFFIVCLRLSSVTWCTTGMHGLPQGYPLPLVVKLNLAVTLKNTTWDNVIDFAVGCWFLVSSIISVNLLALAWNMWQWFKNIIAEHLVWIKFMSTSCEISPRWMPLYTLDD